MPMPCSHVGASAAPRFLKLNRPLADNTACDGGDVHDLKTLLADLGYYPVPDWGVTDHPDRALFDAIRAYQKERGLKVDGMMKPGGETEVSLRTLQTRNLKAQEEDLRSRGRFGDTILAHISPAEARLLDAVTDGGSINPETGLPEFWNQDQGSGGIVHVDAYTQNRNGTSTSVTSHTRSAPGSGGLGSDGPSHDRFDELFNRVLEREGGGYVNDPADLGGETNHGITKRTLDAYQKQHGGLGKGGEEISVRELTREQAKTVYKKAFYEHYRIGEIKDDVLAEDVFDLHANSRPDTASKILQKSINDAVPEANLDVDGRIGSKTIGALNDAMPRQRQKIHDAINQNRAKFYQKRIKEDPSQVDFKNGWGNRLDNLR